MSEAQFQVVNDGTAIQTQDFNALGANALIDDYVLAEFLRLKPYDGSTVDRAVFPYGVTGETVGGSNYHDHSPATVAPNGASGSVLVRPFRAVVGSRTAVGTDSKKNWRDIRSGIWLGSATSLTASVALSANSSGNPRWDLIYASVVPDQAQPTVTRQVRNPGTLVITPTAVVTTLQTTVSVLTVTGTPAASPVFPAVPADGAGAYNIPLAYVRVPNGFGAGSTVLRTDIADAKPVVQLAASLAPASKNSTANVTSAQQNSWGSTGTRPGHILPPDLSRGPSKIIAVDLLNASSANWSHQNGGVVDASMDWRNRLFRINGLVMASALSASNPFIWDPAGGANPSLQIPGYETLGGHVKTMSPAFVAGASLYDFDYAGTSVRDLITTLSESVSQTVSGSPAFTGGIIWTLDNAASILFQTNTQVWFVADATSGNLLLYVKNAPQVALYLWVDCSSQITNSL